MKHTKKTGGHTSVPAIYDRCFWLYSFDLADLYFSSEKTGFAQQAFTQVLLTNTLQYNQLLKRLTPAKKTSY